jgi:hypothetical protein
MMRRYLTYALLFDLGLCILLTLYAILFKEQVKTIFNATTMLGLNKLTNAMITVGATLMGFLLTIITVIVTFKKGFEDDKRKQTVVDNSENQKRDPLEGIQKTVFDHQVSKEVQFYNTNLHKRVGIIFTNATYECGIVLFVLLLLQFEALSISLFYFALLVLLCFICLCLAIIRSLYIFKYFLRVHLHDAE